MSNQFLTSLIKLLLNMCYLVCKWGVTDKLSLWDFIEQASEQEASD